MKVIRKRLGELLLETEKITAEELEKALAFQKKTGERLGKAVVQLGRRCRQEARPESPHGCAFWCPSGLACATRWSSWRAQRRICVHVRGAGRAAGPGSPRA